MRLDLDAYVERRSPIHTWEARCKLVGCMALILAFACVQRLWLLPAMIAVTLIFYSFSRLPLSFLRHRLRYPGLFLLGIVALVPFVSGETVVWQWQQVTVYREGLEAVLLITTRFFSILTVALILVGTTPFLSLLQALRSLGLSPILADMTMLTYRYLYDVTENLATMQTAMQLRGGTELSPAAPRSRWWSRLRHVAALLGTLLIRSYEQSERVYKAMRLRGYGHPATTGAIARSPIPLSSWFTLMGIGAIALSFVVAELWLPHP